MKKLQIGLIIVGILFLSGLIYEGCREIRDFLSPRTPSGNNTLKEGEKEKIIIDSNGDVKKIRRGRDGKTQVEKISTGTGRVELVIKDDGTVEYREKVFGFIFEPGIQTSMDDDAVLLGLDARFFYWRNFGVVSGLSYAFKDDSNAEDSLRRFRVHAGFSYRLPFQKFRNTSVFAAYNNQGSYQVGVRTKF